MIQLLWLNIAAEPLLFDIKSAFPLFSRFRITVLINRLDVIRFANLSQKFILRKTIKRTKNSIVIHDLEVCFWIMNSHKEHERFISC